MSLQSDLDRLRDSWLNLVRVAFIDPILKPSVVFATLILRSFGSMSWNSPRDMPVLVFVLAVVVIAVLDLLR